MPLPNHKVIPDSWSQRHRPVAEGVMTAIGTITIPAPAADATFNDTTGQSTQGDPSTIYTRGPMRVLRLNRSQANGIVSGERDEAVRYYRVSVPIDGPTIEVPANALVRIDECDDDATLVGKTLIVREAPPGSLMWDRSLYCEDTQPAAR